MGTRLIENRQRGANLDRLTDQQRMFVLHLLASENYCATEAARKAKYKKPKQAAYRLLNQKRIKAALGKAKREREERCELDGDRVLKEVAHCALRDPIDLCDKDGRIVISDMREIPEHFRRCIDGIKCRNQYDKHGNLKVQTIELRLVPKMAALELAAKHFGLLGAEKHEVKHVLDWDSLYERPDEIDAIDRRLALDEGNEDENP